MPRRRADCEANTLISSALRHAATRPLQETAALTWSAALLTAFHNLSDGCHPLFWLPPGCLGSSVRSRRLYTFSCMRYLGKVAAAKIRRINTRDGRSGPKDPRGMQRVSQGFRTANGHAALLASYESGHGILMDLMHAAYFKNAARIGQGSALSLRAVPDGECSDLYWCRREGTASLST